ncbi:MAG TPA: hypothetical protein VMM36_04535 [Opitutaceae bacterium]|nr:hypothetical protein [Opitutaceae bacterium]
MSHRPTDDRRRLPRLAPVVYRGLAFVHWSMPMEHRATGWLDPVHHARIREYLCHALARYDIVCPAYCLMTDHGHFLWVGISDESDQRKAAKLFREAWNTALSGVGVALQRQAHDHVLREHERERGAFVAIAHYIFGNPVRAGLVGQWRAYPFLGALVPGYPGVDPREEDFWEKFWRIYARLIEPSHS